MPSGVTRQASFLNRVHKPRRFLAPIPPRAQPPLSARAGYRPMGTRAAINGHASSVDLLGRESQSERSRTAAKLSGSCLRRPAGGLWLDREPEAWFAALPAATRRIALDEQSLRGADHVHAQSPRTSPGRHSPYGCSFCDPRLDCPRPGPAFSRHSHADPRTGRFLLHHSRRCRQRW